MSPVTIMLKWKTVNVAITENDEEVLVDVLAGMTGKNRVIKFLGVPVITGRILRVYRDAEQIVDVDVTLFTADYRLLVVDLPLAEGQLCKAGFKDTSDAPATYKLIIGYEETG
ncbi:unnamed protein product [marine sediment metagenome]|uniref:Uncharacterized protein n=1 Tax=marine sediment metagenome TaxID=412755 RepID=X1JF37_9ZZZZ